MRLNWIYAEFCDPEKLRLHLPKMFCTNRGMTMLYIVEVNKENVYSVRKPYMLERSMQIVVCGAIEFLRTRHPTLHIPNVLAGCRRQRMYTNIILMQKCQ